MALSIRNNESGSRNLNLEKKQGIRQGRKSDTPEQYMTRISCLTHELQCEQK